MATNQGQSSTQDNVVKQPAFMRTADNAAGNESGETVLISGTGQSAIFAPPVGEINGTYGHENRSAKWKNGESIDHKQHVPEAGQNQYQ